MERFAKAFARNPDGSWRCIASARFTASDGVTVACEPGSTYRKGQLLHGFDVAARLHDWHQFGLEPSGVEFPDG